jgi:mono/diheme cytochrome c family protein
MSRHTGSPPFGLTVGLALTGLLLAAGPLQAQPSKHPGRAIYVDVGCANCHGSRGQGGVSVDFPKGPSLRMTQLDRDTMTMIVECGIPGTRMPAWLQGAYTDVECYGEALAEEGPAGMIVPGALTKEQIGVLVDYIFDELVQTPQQ